MPAPDNPVRCVVVVPVKPPALGKSRLVGLTDEQRRELAEAFALDTVTAALATPVSSAPPSAGASSPSSPSARISPPVSTPT